MAAFQPPNTTLLALLNASVVALKANPTDETLRTGIFTNQVNYTAQQLNLPTTKAADVVRSYTAAYAYSQGYDPKAVLDALTSAQQQILNYDKNKPTLYGVDLVTANHIASYFAAAAGVLLVVSLALVVVGMFTVGPEAIAAFAGVTSVVGLFQAAVAAVGLDLGAVALASAGGAFLLSQVCGHISNFIPMATKQMVDNGSINPSLQITAIKNVAGIEAQMTGSKAPGSYSSAQYDSLFNGLSAAGITQVKNPETGVISVFSRQSLADAISVLYGRQVLAGSPTTPSKLTPLLNPYLLKGSVSNQIPLSLYDQVASAGTTSAPSQSAPTSSTASVFSGGTSAPAPAAAGVSNFQIYTGVISGGTLGLPQEFTAAPASVISSMTDLVNSAQINLAGAVQSLPGRFFYEIAIVNSIKTKSGFTQKGAPITIVTGYYKNGTPKTKIVYMKFAQMKLSVTDENGKIVKLATINLGPVDVTTFSPSQTQLSSAQDTIKSSTFTTNITSVQTVVSPTPPTTTTSVTAAVTPDTTVAPTAPTQAPIATPNGQVVPIPVTIYTPADGVFRGVGNIGDNMYRTLPNGGFMQINLISPTLGLVPQPPPIGAGNQVALAQAALKSRYNFDWNALPQVNMGDYIQALSRKPGTGYNNSDGSFVINPAYVVQSTNLMDFIGQKSASLSPSEINNNVSAKIVTNSAASAATTLSEYYTALGMTLPSGAERAALYESAGLGPASTYVLSADQNNKLLGWLKSH